MAKRLCAAFLMHCILLTAALSNASAAASPITLEAVEAWIEIDSANYPHFFEAISSDAAADGLELIALFIPERDEARLKNGQFELLNTNIMLTRAVRPFGPVSHVKQSQAISFGKTAVGSPELLAWYVTSFASGADSSPIEIHVPLNGDSNRKVLLYPVQTVNSWGFAPSRPICQIVSSLDNCQIRYNTVINELADLDRVLQVHLTKLNFSVTPGLISSISGEILDSPAEHGLLLYAAALWRDGGWLEKAEPVLRRLYSDMAENNFSEARKLEAAFQLSMLLIVQNKFSEAESVIADAEKMLAKLKLTDPGVASLEVIQLKLKWSVASLYNAQGRFSEALTVLQGNLDKCIALFGENSERTILWKGAIVSYMLDLEDYVSPHEFLPDVFVGVTERYPPPRQAPVAFLMALVLGQQGFNREGEFYAKILVGLDSFSIHEYNSKLNSPPPSGLNTQEVIESLSDGYDLKNLDSSRISQLLDQPNEPGNTAYNKASALMVGAERELYLQYGMVATSLNEAGQLGTEAEKEKAREVFRGWMKSAHEALEPLQ